LHAREDGIASAWVVHKPTDQGLVSSLEIFGPDGENVALLFANRTAGAGTVSDWKALLRGLD
jgi:putative hemin transport protein